MWDKGLRYRSIRILHECELLIEKICPKGHCLASQGSAELCQTVTRRPIGVILLVGSSLPNRLINDYGISALCV